MSRFTAILFLVLAAWASPAFSAEPQPGTTHAPALDIDPVTGLARDTVVRPLRDAPAVPDARRELAPHLGPHIALVLPTKSPSLGRLAEALRLGFTAAAEVAGKEAPPIHGIALENEGASIGEACRAAHAAGALLVVGGMTRDGAAALASSDCARRPALALNELRGDIPPTVYSVSLSIEQEARQAALAGVEAGLRQAIVIHTPSPISRRVQEAFEREWVRAAGEVRRIAFSGAPEDASALRERIANTRGDMVFLALDHADALAVRPYISAMLPVYSTTLGVNPRADPLVNLDLQGVRYFEMPWFIAPDHPAVMVYPPAQGLANVEQERLYALGIDAFRLALILVKGDKPVLDGVTGRITLEAGNHFARQLSAADIDGGRILPARAP